MFFSNLKIGIKLGIGFGLVLLIFGGLSYYTYNSLQTLGEAQHVGAHTAEDAVFLGIVDSRAEHLYSIIGDTLLSQDVEAGTEEFSEFREQAQKDIERVYVIAGDADKRGAQQFEAAYTDYMDVFDKKVVPTLQSGVASLQALSAIGLEAAEARRSTMEHLDAMLEKLNAAMVTEDERFDALHGSTMSTTLYASIGGVLAALLLGGIITISIARPINSLSEEAEAIAEGNFRIDLTGLDRRDEVGGVASALSKVRDNCARLEDEIETMAAEVQRGNLTYRGSGEGFMGEYAEIMNEINRLAVVYTDYLDNIPSPVMTIDTDFNVLFMNKAGAAAGNIDSKALIGTKCFDHFRTEDCNTKNCACHRSIQTSQNQESQTIARPEVGTLDISYAARPIKDKSGKIVGAIELVTDLTEIRQAERRMVKIANSAEGISQRLSVASEQLAAQVDQVSKGAGVQRDRVGETATAMEQMNATVLEVARNASSASTSSNDAKAEAERGADIVGQAVAAIAEVLTTTEGLRENMRGLERETDAIGKVMDVITDIADQTNLLALNAAIEAARAGDAGRGFAVVADEVRKLAEKTMGATKEVGESISSIQTSATVNLKSVESATEMVNRATELASRSGETLSAIVNLAGDSASQVEGIATASEEQSAASEQINAALEDVNVVVGETAEGMVDSSRSVNELTSMTAELNSLIMELQSSGNGSKAA
ncbi:methyl-accepting chemotaxis protein [Salidesulfovibrio brasiliensis]|uniref:methyl-accepting chemotaxis protein n=1 Tax=Salidesulfovibrio brasiliensis TaxID=221711 RepID=UPI0006D22AE5|nr:methyl-accepting chemotaxis protein [Salidesulfovibrio brasiliensis]